MDDVSTAVDTTVQQVNNCKQANGVQQTSIVDTDHESEKCDRSPEIHEKGSYDLTPSDHSTASANRPNTIASTTETISSITTNDENNTASHSIDCDNSGEADRRIKSAGFAFTIDFNDGKSVDNRKFKEIAERLQQRQQLQQEQRRHRRGVSLSKLDDTRKSTTSLNNVDAIRAHALDDSNIPSPTTATAAIETTTATSTAEAAASAALTIAAKPPFKQRQGKTDDTVKSDEKPETHSPKVVFRRPRPTSQSAQLCKDQSKRHSWSPRSSMNYDKLMQQQLAGEFIEADNNNVVKRSDVHNGQFQPKSTILQRALECQTNRTNKQQNASNGGKNKMLPNETNFVVTTPLEFIRLSDDEGSMEMISEAGTYTLDGDNYTEEEKERMSIDKLSRKQFDLSIDSKQTMHELNKNYAIGMRQAMNVNYPKCDTTALTRQRHTADMDTKCAQKPSKISYLDKIKSRVRNIGDRTFHKNGKALSASPTSSVSDKLRNLKIVRTDGDDSNGADIDHGVFTSITACGILNKPKPEHSMSTVNHRKKCLTKFHIDSSEYIQPKVDDKLMNCYTDYEKAHKQKEYKLNIFSTVSTYTSSATTSPQHTDDDNLSIECIDDKPISIKTAPTKNDWIQEWAKNARRHNHSLGNSASASPKLQHQTKTNRAKQQSKGDNRMSQSYDVAYFNDGEQFGDDVNGVIDSDECAAHLSRAIDRSTTHDARKMDVAEMKGNTQATNLHRPPISPTKIPSPMHAQLRARSSSANRSFRNSNLHLDISDTEMYLEKTAAAISSLQKIHRRNNSPQSPLSPIRKTPTTQFAPSITRASYDKSIASRSLNLHKRNKSMDASHHTPQPDFYGFDADDINERLTKRHTRHNSYENQQIHLPSPVIDQTIPVTRHRSAEYQQINGKYSLHSKTINDEHARRSSADNVVTSPLRRSSSFCIKDKANPVASKVSIATTPTALKKTFNRRVSGTSNAATLQKSASSSSFKNVVAATASTTSEQSSYSNQNCGDTTHATYFINGKDNLQTSADDFYSSDDSAESTSGTGDNSNNKYEMNGRQAAAPINPPISHTRYNKAFLMRIEQNKQVASGNKGVIACPNTPEMPRRSQQRASFRDPTSMPRDSSLSRMKQELPNLQATKKALSSKDSIGSGGSGRVLPKYMDISKYKPVQGQQFLKRDESKSTLITRNEIRKSPSAIGLSKADPTRASGRVKSAGAKPNAPVNAKEAKAREQELAMWKRRATYDPMKAAAEGRKKQEEAKKTAQKTIRFNDSLAVLRSQSFHSGVGQLNSLQLRQQFSEDSFDKNRWTMVSTEPSDEEDEFGDVGI